MPAVKATVTLRTDLLKAGFNDGVPVFDGRDGVWMAVGQDGLAHADGFVQSHLLLLQFLHELLEKATAGKDLRFGKKKLNKEKNFKLGPFFP